MLLELSHRQKKSSSYINLTHSKTGDPEQKTGFSAIWYNNSMQQKSLYERIDHFFDKLEDRVRAHLSKRPILYTFIAGFGIVLFWRGVWHTADIVEAQGGIWATLFSGPGSIVISVIILLATGLFVSFFVGDVIIMSGLRKEKKFVEKAQEEIEKESKDIKEMEGVLKKLEKEVEHIHKEHEHNTESRSGGGIQPKS